MKAEYDLSLASAAEEVRRCAEFYLLWVASADGPANDTQVGLVARIMAEEGEASESLKELAAIAEEREFDSLLFAARTLRDRLTDEEQQSLLGLAMQVGWQAGQLGPGANHICRFLADLFDISPVATDQLHRDLFDQPLYKPADVSDPHWWFTDSPHAADYIDERRQALLDGADPLTREEALLILELNHGAGEEAVRQAYRRLAQAYHPDRVDAATRGGVSRDKAHARFLRVREAYEVLTT
ncbi:DnaJ domain-containing protein [Ectothiorhodospiraceae bacterium WFHF3C12]|nr:DnaJ domain-containing protein [Ectothiorhodospiraceae bacterium WFHF3C12]